MSKQQSKRAKEKPFSSSPQKMEMRRFARYVIGEDEVDFTDGLLVGDVASELRVGTEDVLLDTAAIHDQLVRQCNDYGAAGELSVFLSSNSKSEVAVENGDSFREFMRNSLKHCVRADTCPYVLSKFGDVTVSIVFGFLRPANLPKAGKNRILEPSDSNIWRWLIEERLKADKIDGTELLSQLEELTFPSLDQLPKEAVIDLAASLLTLIPTASIHRVIENAELSDAKRKRIHDATQGDLHESVEIDRMTGKEIVEALQRPPIPLTLRQIAEMVGRHHGVIGDIKTGRTATPRAGLVSDLRKVLKKKSRS